MDNTDVALLAEGQSKRVTFCLVVILRNLTKLILFNFGTLPALVDNYCPKTFYKAAINMLSTFRTVEYSSQLHSHKPAKIKRVVLRYNNASSGPTTPRSTHSLLDYALTKFYYIQPFLAL